MSYVALVTRNFNAMISFYTKYLRGSELDAWDREHARGARLEVVGLTVELLDAHRESDPPVQPPGCHCIQLVFEVDDVDLFVADLPGSNRPVIEEYSWGARGFRDHDPDGTVVHVIEWKRQMAT